MKQLSIETEYGYGGETNYNIVETAEGREPEIVATVYGRRDVAEQLIEAARAFEVLEKM